MEFSVQNTRTAWFMVLDVDGSLGAGPLSPSKHISRGNLARNLVKPSCKSVKLLAEIYSTDSGVGLRTQRCALLIDQSCFVVMSLWFFSMLKHLKYNFSCR